MSQQAHLTAAQIQNLEQRYRANLINSITGFKSLNLVGTVNATGQTNLAVFSQVFHVGANPPLIGMLVRPHTVPRHTLENLEATGFYTLNHVQESFVNQAHHTSARWEESEFAGTGLTPQNTPLHPAPYVQEAAIKIGLAFKEKQTLAINGTVLVIGQVIELMFPEHIQAADGYLDIEQAGSITCSGLDTYHTTQKVVRLSYAKPDLTPNSI